MKKLRLLAALLVVAELLVVLLHTLALILGVEFPIEFYVVAPIVIIFIVGFALLIAPLVEWIIGEQ